MNNWYYIKNIDCFVERIRQFSFEKFLEINDSCKEDFINLHNKEVDSLITTNESKNIIISMAKKYKFGYKISEKNIIRCIEKLNSRMISNSLLNLVSSGVLESAFDSELNDFVFWEKK